MPTKTPRDRARAVLTRLYEFQDEDYDLENDVAAEIQQAVAEALACPLPAPMPADEIGKIEEWLEADHCSTDEESWRLLSIDLVRHIRHLEALIRDITNDPALAYNCEAVLSAYRLGQERMKDAVCQRLRDWGNGRGYAADQMIAQAILTEVTDDRP